VLSQDVGGQARGIDRGMRHRTALLAEVLGAEGERQQVAERHRADDAGHPGEMDGRLEGHELAQPLAAGAARGGEPGGLVGDHEGLDDPAPPGRDHDPDGRASAHWLWGSSRVLDVRRGMDTAVRVAKRGADRVGGVGA